MTAAEPARRRASEIFAGHGGRAWLAGAFLLVAEILIQTDVISRFIVPPPSEIIGSFYRVITKEHVLTRFLLTAAECLTAGAMITVFGIAGGVLMHRFKLLQQACETWVAAMASAPVVLMYPLFMVIFGRNAWTIIMIGFIAALPPVILKTIEGIAGTRKVLVNVGQELQSDADPAVLEDPVSRRRCRPFSSAYGSG